MDIIIESDTDSMISTHSIVSADVLHDHNNEFLGADAKPQERCEIKQEEQDETIETNDLGRNVGSLHLAMITDMVTSEIKQEVKDEPMSEDDSFGEDSGRNVGTLHPSLLTDKVIKQEVHRSILY